MAVIATCRDCGDEHPLRDRRHSPEHIPVVCPVCDSPSYSSEGAGDVTIKSEAQRIHDAVADVRGVGEKNLRALQSTFGLYVELEAADVDELAQVEGIGQTTAERIAEAV